MKTLRILQIFLLSAIVSVSSLKAETVISSFEGGLTEGTVFVDEWESSPFNTGACVNTTVEVIDNPYINEMNETSKVLHYVRPYYAGDRNGVEIKLENNFTLTTTKRYLHVLVHKPVISPLVMTAIDKNNNVMQVITLSRAEVRANAWSDAIFAVKGNGYEIDRIRIYPDCQMAVNRLSGDIDVYIDEIVLSDSDEPRTASSYCFVKGTQSVERYVSYIQTQGALFNLKMVQNDVAPKITNKIANTCIIAEQGATFDLTFAQKSTSANNAAWVADVFADFNNDKEYVSADEYLGRVTGVVSGDSVLYTTQITVPETALLGAGSLRIKLTDSSDAAVAGDNYSSCENVQDGVVFDMAMEIQRNIDKPIIKIEGLSSQSGWGTIGFKGYEGTELKVFNGTKITVQANASAGHTFVGWYIKGSDAPISTDAAFAIAVKTNVTLIAKFAEIAYCKPTSLATYFAGKISITPAAQTALYYIGDAANAVDEVDGSYVAKSVLGGVNVKRGSSFALNVEKAASSASFASAQMAVWVDWNGDHTFDASELVANAQGEDAKEFTVSVPTTALKGDTYVRLRIAGETLSATDACTDVAEGVTYDLQVTVAPGNDERFSLSAVPDIEGAATFTLSPLPDEDGKYAAGTNVAITAVPASGYNFVQWKKDGIPYGATMTSNNPLPITSLSEDLVLTMAMEAAFPSYCAGTAPNNSDGDHYGINAGSVSVNSEQAFTFAKASESIVDLSSTCIAEVCPGDTIKLFVSGVTHSQWSQGIAYIDWNMDGTWDTSTEAYEMFNNPLVQVTNLETRIIVPDNVGVGTCGIRLCSGEAPAYNSLGGGPCQARKRGTLFTFRLNISALPVSSATQVKVSCDENKGRVEIHGTTEKIYEAEENEVVTVEATPLSGYEFTAWTTRTGTVLSTSAVYSFTVNKSYDLVAVFTSETPTYCTGTAAYETFTFYLNSVSISSSQGTVSATTSSSLNDFQSSKIIEVQNGETLTFTYSSNSSNTRWGNVVIFVDWNRDGEFSVTDEKYDIYGGTDGSGQSGHQYANETYQITVPMSAYAGMSAIRIVSEEATQHNVANNFDPCGARHKGSVHTFGLRIIDPTVNLPVVEEEKTAVYPNPVKSTLFVRASINDRIKLLTMEGVTVKTLSATDNLTSFNVSDLPAGIYLLQIVGENGVTTSTVCKK